MYGYKFYIWQPVYHNDKFSHNITRYVTIHALSTEEAKSKVHLFPGEITKIHDGLTVRVDDEHIHSTALLGRAVRTSSWKYVKEEEIYNVRGR